MPFIFLFSICLLRVLYVWNIVLGSGDKIVNEMDKSLLPWSLNPSSVPTNKCYSSTYYVQNTVFQLYFLSPLFHIKREKMWPFPLAVYNIPRQIK